MTFDIDTLTVLIFLIALALNSRAKYWKTRYNSSDNYNETLKSNLSQYKDFLKKIYTSTDDTSLRLSIETVFEANGAWYELDTVKERPCCDC